MKKIISGMALSIIATAAMAQETYESAALATQDLNGTARYIGMGGAMEALGADISTISSNPAGIGLFRKSWVGVSGGATIQKASFENGGLGNMNATLNQTGVTNADLNQLGFVYSTKVRENSGFNFSINYSKNRNFNQITNAINSLNAASLNKMTYMRLASLNMNEIKGGATAWNSVSDHSSIGDNRESFDYRWTYISQLDKLNYSLVNNFYSQNVEGDYWMDDYVDATAYCGQKNESGYISNFDFNISGSINDRVFLGLTFGLKDVRYGSYNCYDELLEILPNNYQGESYGITDDRHIKGTGYDAKFGIIVRPFENSGFRIGAYVHTPTWYTLNCYGNISGASSIPYYQTTSASGTTSNQVIMPNASGSADDIYTVSYANDYSYDYQYKIVTPWKFGFSLGHTIGNTVAIGATYEYADYSSMKNKIYDYTSYDYYADGWGGYYDEYDVYERDDQMDANTEASLKGVHTLKFGVEVKPVPEVAIRMGYNWVSPMYNEDGCKDMFIYASRHDGSVGSYYSTYDYTNWKDTHRLTFGLGFKLSDKINLDLAYQYSTQKGDYHPFQSTAFDTVYGINADGSSFQIMDGTGTGTKLTPVNYGTPTEVKNNRHQLSCTLGIKF